MKIDALTCKKLSCIVVAISLIASPASAIAEESENVVTSSEESEVVSETADEVTSETIAGVTDSEIVTNDGDYQDNIFVSSSLLSAESTSPALVAQSDEDIASGEYYGLTWKITFDGALILGDGTEQTYGPISVTNSDAQPWYAYRTSITSVEVDGVVHSTSNSLMYFLYGATNLLAIDLDGLDTGNATSMKDMFYNCSKLTSLNVSNFDTSNVTDMNYMFGNCYALTSLDISNFDTAKVTNMSNMFNSCRALTSLDVSEFVTSNVTNTSWMFFGCRALTSLNLSKFDTAKVTDMSYMFGSCKALTSLDVSNFVTSSVTNMNTMFSSCNALTSLDLSNFDTTNVTNMSYMFYNSSKLTSIDLSEFNTAKVTNMIYMFSGCSGLTSLNISSFVTSSTTNMSYMFFNCSKLTSLDLNNFDTSNVTNMSRMFSGCSKLTSLNVNNFVTTKVTNMNYMFYGCSKLTSLDVSNFDTSNVTDISYMFSGCSALVSLDVSRFDTVKVTNMNSVFYNCYCVEILDVSNFDTSNVTNMSQMFYSCRSLTYLDVSKFNTTNATDMINMFYGCSKLTSLDISSFDMGLASSTYNTSFKLFGIESMLAYCKALSSIKFGENNVLYTSGDVNGTEVSCSVGLPNAPTNDNYQGKWWINGGIGYTATDLMSSYDGSTMAGTYEWMPVAYAITYVAPDGLLFGNGEQTVTMNVIKNSSFEVATGNELLEDSAYYVVSWNTQSDGSGVAYEEGVTYVPTSDVTLYAVTEMGGVATGKTDIHNLDSNGDDYGDNISFSVPTSIYGYVNADGSVFVNDSDFYIENCSSEDISIEYVTSDGWDSRVNVVDDASSSTAENAMSITMEPVTSDSSSSTPIRNGSATYLYSKISNPNWKVRSGSFTSPTKLYIDVEMSIANADDELFSYEPMKIGSMHWYCQLAKYADIK